MADSFNKELDKVTEAEVVYDFFNRLSTGKDIAITSTNSSKIPAHTSVPALIQQIFENFPTTLSNSYGNLTRCTINITAGITSSNVTLTGSYTLIKAYSENSNMDYASAITKTTSSGSTIFTISVDTPFTMNDTINLYVKKA